VQSSMRVSDNPALCLAIDEANRRNLPLLVFFSIDATIPMANERNFTFMLEGLEDFRRSVEASGASMCIRLGDAAENVAELCTEADFALLVTDESHLKEGIGRRKTAAGKVRVPVYRVDANVVVPVREIPGEQYAAYAIRPKLMRLLPSFLKSRNSPVVKNAGAPEAWSDVERVDVRKLIKELMLPGVPPSPKYRGGESQAQRTLQTFIDKKLDGYAVNRNRPDVDGTSDMSPYLRFGQISPVRMLREVIDSGQRQEDIDAFVEEAFVRRELAENFTFYNPYYRSLEALPDWARATLEKHKDDKRPRVFTMEELESGRTGDELWDASQYEMARYGKMSGYMRMYWGKRVIEWAKTPGEALSYLIYLNDKYEIDGRSPNGYAGVMWCFGKHDRAFGERPVYGKVRYMSPAAIRKKFDFRSYFRRSGFGEEIKAYTESPR
jgi:deoxyribodipyrimidine photo-lyase